MAVDSNNRRHRYFILLLASDVNGAVSYHELMLDAEHQYVTQKDLNECKELMSNKPGSFGTIVIQSISYLGFTSKNEFYGQLSSESLEG